MVRYFRLLLFPFSLLYGLVVWLRNKLYDWKIFRAESYDLPVICVGNLVVGGAGKTPMTEYLVSLLPEQKVAILSRGYGRKTKGFIQAGEGDTVATIGDEPMQYYKKLKGVTVAVCEDRRKGISILQPDHDVIILDDAFQHRRVKAGLNILLFEFKTLFNTQWLLPAGNLRESFSAYRRADILVVTKAPTRLQTAEAAICKQRFDADASPFFASIYYHSLVALADAPSRSISESTNTNFFLLTGIANPEPLVFYLSQFGKVIKHYLFPDHYNFQLGDIQKIAAEFEKATEGEKIIVTTEKDVQRLISSNLDKLLVNLPAYYLPVSTEIIAGGKADFDNKIKDYVASNKRNS